MKLTTLALSLSATSLLGLGACADLGPDPAEDGAEDAFLGSGKADAFGVEDWSPDGAAVLRLVSERSKTELRDDVGLSARVATNIVAARAQLGGEFEDLAELDAVSYVGTRVFSRLLDYANATEMFRTSIRVPISVYGDGGELQSITEWNDEARAAGLRSFARYTFVDRRTDYSAKMASYQARLDAVFAAGGSDDLAPELVVYAHGPIDFESVESLCYVGRGAEVADTVASGADDLFGDMFSIWASRFEDQIWVYDENDDDTTLREMLEEEDLDADEVAMIWTNSDDGGDPYTSGMSPCR